MYWFALAVVACWTEFRGINFIVTATTNTGLKVYVLNHFPYKFLKMIVIKGLESLGITSSCYLWVQQRESFYSALLSEKRLCRWARLQCWLRGKCGKNILAVLHVCHEANMKEREGGTCQVMLLERFSNRIYFSRSYHGLLCTSVKSKSCFSSSAAI